MGVTGMLPLRSFIFMLAQDELEKQYYEDS